MLKLVLIHFRIPPFEHIAEGPNLFRSCAIHPDSSIAFCELIQEKGFQDWNLAHSQLMLQSRKAGMPGYPSCILWETQHRYPLCSALVPVSSLDSRSAILWIPSRIGLSLEFSFEDGRAELEKISKSDLDFPPEISIPLRKRDKIERLSWHPISRRGIAEIYVGKGPCRAIDTAVKFMGWNLSSWMGFIAQVKDSGKFHQCLEMISKLGMGKKRSMGYGEVIGIRSYDLVSAESLDFKLSPDLLQFRDRDVGIVYITSLRLLGLDAMRIKLGDLRSLGALSLDHILSSPTPPYWVKKQLCLAPFSQLISREIL